MMADGNGLRLDDRAVLRIGGPEAAALLQGLVTCEIDALSPGAASHGALLTPQGKVLFDAIIQRPDMETFLFDTSAALAGDFLKRLMFYRLRAKVTLEVADDLAVVAWPDGGPADARIYATETSVRSNSASRLLIGYRIDLSDLCDSLTG